LKWLEQADPAGYVDASAESETATALDKFCTRDKTVRTLFSSMLWWAAACSLLVLLGYWNDRLGIIDLSKANPSLEFYDEHAVALADSYESVAFENAYPFLANVFTDASSPLEVLDIGAGTGRDAAWISSKGHNVLAVEPSSSMLTIAKNLHPSKRISWLKSELPGLDLVDVSFDNFDVILLNAVWMHIVPQDRAASLKRIRQLLNPGGSIFVSLRLGPVDEGRGMFEVSGSQFALDAKAAGFNVVPRGDYEDLLGRAEVSWKMFELKLGNP
jgi:SAM-dependent methyltransferase